MLRLLILCFLILPSVCHGQMFLINNVKEFHKQTTKITKIEEEPDIQGNVVYIYLNKAYQDNPEYQLIQDLLNDDFSREKVRIRLQIDCGILDGQQESEELDRVKSKWEQIKRNVRAVETEHHISPCYNHSQYSDNVYEIAGDFYNLDGSVEKIQFPSQIIEKLSLEIYILNYYRGNSHTADPFALYTFSNASNKIIGIKHDVCYFGNETVRFSYIDVDFINKKIPIIRLTTLLNKDDFGNITSLKEEIFLLSEVDKYKIYIKYIKYLHYNTSMDYSEDILIFEESLIRQQN